MADYNMGIADQSSAESKSAIANIIKNMGSQPKQTKDGQPQKRRGPKPDSKPAMTRRQEMNRLAQRTHRERKERHIKELEQKVLSLNELWQATIVERDQARAEVFRLQQLLKSHGIVVELTSPSTTYNPTIHSFQSTGASTAGSGRHDSTTTATTATSPSPFNPRSPSQMPPANINQSSTQRMDYDQLGIDFVLALEHPCMEHLQYLVVRSQNPDNQPFRHPMDITDPDLDHMSGHTLMLSCPPMSHIMTTPEVPYPHKMPEVPKADLMKLFQASARLPTDGGELTPVQAWMAIMRSDRAATMTRQQFQLVQADLVKKVRCYGFGAVMDEWEVSDAIDRAFKQEVDMDLISGLSDFALHRGHAHAHAHAHPHIMA